MPTNTDLKKIITMNLIQNNEITHEDIDMEERTYGKPRKTGTIRQQNPMKTLP